MKKHLVELRIESLLLAHREVERETVEEYILKYTRGEEVPPVNAFYCVHTGNYELCDGHHRTVARHFLGKPTVVAFVEPCYLYECDENEDIKCYNVRHVTQE